MSSSFRSQFYRAERGGSTYSSRQRDRKTERFRLCKPFTDTLQEDVYSDFYNRNINNMVWSMETDAEPPLSVILPRLYLGAERDVTQDGLASHGISYVLSVSRCSPQPSFLPASRYMRIPIDDSLWADLLPWIPQALHFIDEAISSGASVLVHCAAGISRSPALAVAYIMYSLGMDMDQAYRFVKERRPSISPNFNFLGQLQQFQGTLTHKSSAAHLPIQLNDNHSVNHTNTIQHNMNQEATHMDNTQHTHPAQHRRPCSDIGSFSGKHKTLHLTLNLNLNQQQQQCGVSAPSPCEPVQPEVAAEAAEKPTQLHLPAFSASSLRDKRKSLTLSLTPLGTGPMAPAVVEESNTVRRNSGWCRQQTQTQDQGKEQGLMSPFSFSLNKLLDWGERLLLGGLSVQPVRMGTPALPYRC